MFVYSKFSNTRNSYQSLSMLTTLEKDDNSSVIRAVICEFVSNYLLNFMTTPLSTPPSLKYRITPSASGYSFTAFFTSWFLIAVY